jgi:signal transduction histidine kinase
MRIFKKFQNQINKHAAYSDPIMVLFGIFGLINYPIFYFFWKIFADIGYDDLWLRLGATALCLPLTLKNFWPDSFKPFIPFYWYLTIIYCLPFFGIYVFLQTNGSSDWSFNLILGLFWLITVLDWVSFAFVSFLGIAAACIIYRLQGGIFYDSETNVLMVISNITFVITTSLLFIRKKDFSHQEKLRTMKMLAGSIAHELRTPLSAMMMGGRALGKILPAYQEAYTKAKSAHLLEQTVSSDQETYLASLPQNIQTVSQNAHTMITMLLTNLNEGMAGQKLERCSIAFCIEEALTAYPFSSDERRLVHWQGNQSSHNNTQVDFSFLGHKELMKHVLFNLFKNALYAIASTGKGEIFIIIEPRGNTRGKRVNQLIFKDTGPGIPPENLRHIFDRFYTKKEHGTGIGLAFCQSVIQSFGGEITCTSRPGDYTTFTISFPALLEKA